MSKLRELAWLAPFVCLGLIALAPMRSRPVHPMPAQSRMVTDAEGMKVAVPLPFRAIVGFGGSDFLETTHAPETLLKGGGTRERARFASGLMSHIYPDVLKDDSRWNCPFDAETLLARDKGATYFSWYGPLDLRRIGLPVLARGWQPKNRDEQVFTAVQVETAAMSQKERGEAFIRDYQQAYADLSQDLQLATLTSRPRVLGMGSCLHDWNFLVAFGGKDRHFDDWRIGVDTASDGFMDIGRQQEAERILAMNPDIILLFGESVQDFLHDKRWEGLKAVQFNRVYQGLRSLRGSTEPLYGLDYRPLWARWEAEIAHPERLQPKVHKLVREHFSQAYGYHLSNEEIDNLLRIDENKGSAGYTRFGNDDLADRGRGTSR